MHTPRPANGAFFLADHPPRIGDLLLARGLITADQLAFALACRGSSERLGETLVRLRIVFEDDLVRTLASQLSLDYVDLVSGGVDQACARLLPEAVARELDAVPVRSTTGGTVVVAVADPIGLDLALLERTVQAPVEVRVAELSAVRQTLDRVWRTARPAAASPTAASAAHLSIRVARPERADDLRDYLARMGAAASLQPDGRIAVTRGSLAHASPAGERADLEEFLRTWAALNGVPAVLDP